MVIEREKRDETRQKFVLKLCVECCLLPRPPGDLSSKAVCFSASDMRANTTHKRGVQLRLEKKKEISNR